MGYHLSHTAIREFEVHYRLVEWLGIGWSGVDLFFVLSGFLITGVLLDAKEKPHYFRNFFIRRALRIFPLYYSVLALAFVARALVGESHLFGNANPAWLWLYGTNFVLATGKTFGVFDHFWSLAIEEHFYLVWPVLVWLLNQRQLLLVTILLWIATALLRAAMVFGDYSAQVIYVLTFTRLDSLAAGALLALVARGPSGLQPLMLPAWLILLFGSFLIAVLVALGGPHQDNAYMLSIGLSAFTLLFGSTILLAVGSQAVGWICSIAVLRWFGRYSYALYIWHPIVFTLVFYTEAGRALRGRSPDLTGELLAVVVAVAGTIAMSLCSWFLLERRFLDLKHKFA
jgi:peptidoglycan/LPS O-acetylase OafA/YrhL